MTIVQRATTDFPYKRGEFTPWFIPREMMPQIDDQTTFKQWCAAKGFPLLEKAFDPFDIICRQRVSIPYAMQIPDWKLAEPGIISLDAVMLDGNHRWLKHLLLKHESVTLIEFGLSFGEAIHALEEWSGVQSEPSTVPKGAP